MTRLNITLYTALPAAKTIINIHKQLIQDGSGNGGVGVPGEDRDHGMGAGIRDRTCRKQLFKAYFDNA